MPAGPAMLADDWSLDEVTIDERHFVVGRIGPYRLGPTLRRTAFGEVILGLRDEGGLAEIDLLDAFVRTPLAGPDGQIMGDLAHIVGLEHRHIATVIGCGLADGAPYVVRRPRLGQTLSALLDRAPRLSTESCAAILFAIADALAFLAEQGPATGSCSMGTFDADDVFLGYDGSIQLVGVGLKLARGMIEAPVDGDLSCCFELARRLDAESKAGLVSTIAPAAELAELARYVRKRHGAACAALRRHIAGDLRRYFADDIREDRAFFGLHTLQ